MITLTLPYPPSVNGMYVPVRGRLILSAKGRKYHSDVLAAVMEAGTPKAPPGRLHLSLELYPPDRRRRDIGNAEKVMSDALVHAGVMTDDSLIDRMELTRREVVRGGKCVVTITQWEPE